MTRVSHSFSATDEMLVSPSGRRTNLVFQHIMFWRNSVPTKSNTGGVGVPCKKIESFRPKSPFISKMIQDREGHSYNGILIGTYTRPSQRRNFE